MRGSRNVGVSRLGDDPDQVLLAFAGASIIEGREHGHSGRVFPESLWTVMELKVATSS